VDTPFGRWIFILMIPGRSIITDSPRTQATSLLAGHGQAWHSTYSWIVGSTAMVNHFYCHCMDQDFGPFFLKFCSYFPYTVSAGLKQQRFRRF
jgi:hypothetical protein